MKLRTLIISHLFVAFLSPILLIGACGIYSKHKIAELDKQYAADQLFAKPQRIVSFGPVAK